MACRLSARYGSWLHLPVVSSRGSRPSSSVLAWWLMVVEDESYASSPYHSQAPLTGSGALHSTASLTSGFSDALQPAYATSTTSTMQYPPAGARSRTSLIKAMGSRLKLMDTGTATSEGKPGPGQQQLHDGGGPSSRPSNDGGAWGEGAAEGGSEVVQGPGQDGGLVSAADLAARLLPLVLTLDQGRWVRVLVFILRACTCYFRTAERV